MEQFNRYCYMAGEGDTAAAGNMEDTLASDEEPAPPDLSHRNYDELMEETPPGAHFLASFTHVPGCKRRVQTRLGCSRVPFIEPMGATREDFYESKLVLGLPWFCPVKPEIVKNDEGQDVTEYTFQFDPPINEIGGNFLESEVLKLGRSDVSFETMCHRLEAKFCDAELGLVCRCCAEEMEGWFGNLSPQRSNFGPSPELVRGPGKNLSGPLFQFCILLGAPCGSCRYAVGFHICRNEHCHVGHHVWRKGTLHAGVLDVQVRFFSASGVG